MTLHLTLEEQELLAEILQEHHRELQREIARTHHREFKTLLRRKEALLEDVLNKVAVPAMVAD